MGAPNLKKEIQMRLDGLVRLRDRVLPIKVGRAAVEMTRDNFRKGGFYGKKWQDPKRKELGFKGSAGGYGPLLSGNNRLMSSNTYKPEKAKVYIQNELPYASIHNDGGSITVTARMKGYFWYRYKEAMRGLQTTSKGRVSNSKGNRAISREAGFWKAMALKKVGSKIEMPERKFIGDHPQLEKEIERIIDNELKKWIDHGKPA